MAVGWFAGWPTPSEGPTNVFHALFYSHLSQLRFQMSHVLGGSVILGGHMPSATTITNYTTMDVSQQLAEFAASRSTDVLTRATPIDVDAGLLAAYDTTPVDADEYA